MEDPELLQKIEDGKFQFVFAMPEDLMDPTKAFQTSILRHPSCAFREKLRAVAVDECHLCWEWGEAGFRKDYAKLGKLKTMLNTVPWICMSGTLPANIASYVHKTLRLNEPTVRFDCPTRRDNIDILRVKMDPDPASQIFSFINQSPSYQLTDRPKVLMFLDGVKAGCRLRDQLLAKFPTHFLHNGDRIRRERVIQVYHGSLTRKLKLRILDDFESGICRFLVCTDAFGLGIDIPDISMVIQVGITDRLSLTMVAQRIGRAGRDPTIKAIAIILIGAGLLRTIANKAGAEMNSWEQAWNWSEEPQPINREGHLFEDGANNDDTTSTSNRIPQRFRLPVTLETSALVRSQILHLYAEAKGIKEVHLNHAKKINDSPGTKPEPLTLFDKLDPPLVWFLCTCGCLHMLLGAFLQDPNLYERSHRSWCCDHCVFSGHDAPDAIQTAGISVMHSILSPHPPTSKDLTSTQEPTGEKFKKRNSRISDAHRMLYRAKVEHYRNEMWKELQLPDTDPRLVLTDEAIDYLIKNLELAGDDDAFADLLRRAGVNGEATMLSAKHVRELFLVLELTMDLVLPPRRILPKPASGTTVCPRMLSIDTATSQNQIKAVPNHASRDSRDKPLRGNGFHDSPANKQFRPQAMGHRKREREPKVTLVIRKTFLRESNRAMRCSS
jgi:superfamily II DNA/RNA helicase